MARGVLKYVVREFPLEAIHPQAFGASEAALCADRQGKYFPFHDILIANPKALQRDDLLRHAGAAGLWIPSFKSCLASGKAAAAVRADIAAAKKLGVRATPSFLLGMQKGDQLQVKLRIRGAYPYETFKDAIERLLESK